MRKIPWDILLIIGRKSIEIDGNMKKILYETHKRFHKIPEVKTYKIEQMFNFLMNSFAFRNFEFFDTIIFWNGIKYKGDITYIKTSTNKEEDIILIPDSKKKYEMGVRISKINGDYKIRFSIGISKSLGDLRRVTYDKETNCFYIEVKNEELYRKNVFVNSQVLRNLIL